MRWLGAVPAHWEARRLRTIASIRISPVDRVSQPGEVATRLLGTDAVYRHPEIRNATRLPMGSATPQEMARFGLHRGDIVITKDSLVPTRIAVPTFIAEEPAETLTCAYHSAIIRPLAAAARYLLWVLRAPQWEGHFVSVATGTTIIGLGMEQIASTPIPLPPADEQGAIVRYLDHMDRRMRRYIRAKQSSIKLLEAEKQAIIHRAVTGQVDVRTGQPYPDYKPSGVQWLGNVPQEWEVRRAKYFYREVDERSATGEEELLSVSHITGVTRRSEKNITMFMAESYVGQKVCRPDDLVINTMWAWMGALGVSTLKGIVSSSYGVYRPIAKSPLSPRFADLLLRLPAYVDEYICRSTGITSSRLRLYPDEFLRIPLICPSPAEQEYILARVASETAEAQKAIASLQSQISLLQEYRTRLIADVVTGKLNVREAAAQLPDELDEDEPLEEAELLEEEDLLEPEDADA